MVRKFENRMIHALVPVNFTIDDVIQWVFPADWIRVLKEAYPLVEHRSYERSSFTDCSAYFLPVMFDMTVNVQAAGMCVPRPAKTNWSIGGIPDNMKTALEELYKVHRDWLKVIKVVEWCNESKATPAAVKYYWPTMAALCPKHTRLQEAEGRLREAVMPPHEMQTLMRETAGIVAGATILPPLDEKLEKRDSITISFGEIDESDPQHPQPKPAPYGAHRYGLL